MLAKPKLLKWCAYALLLLAPGSFIFLPALWLARYARVGSLQTACELLAGTDAVRKQ